MIMFVTLAILVIILISYKLIKKQLYWKDKHVKQGPPVPILGDFFKNTFGYESPTEMVMNLYNKYKNDRYFGLYQGMIPTLVVSDPELIKQITVKDFDHFLNHRNFVKDDVEPMWSKNLLMLKDEKWREMRNTLSPTFTATRMKLMFELMENSAKQFVQYFLDLNEESIELELKDSFTRFANDVIANCAFGIMVDSLKEPHNSFYVNGSDLVNFKGFWKNLKITIMLAIPKLAQFLELKVFNPATTEFFKTIVTSSVKIREEKKIVRPDVINLLMEARKGTLKNEESSEVHEQEGFATVKELNQQKADNLKTIEMTDEDMAAQVMIFFFGGFDTVSTMMTFMCYELAVNPDVQEKLRKEVDEIYNKNNGKFTYDLLSKMKYMDMVTSESLRKHPPFIQADRVCTKNYTIQPERPGEHPVHLKPGDVIWIPIIGLHRDERYFPDPDKFIPERFSDENKHEIPKYTYVPFGSGPRNCIASRFALMEVKTLIFFILTKFEIVVNQKTLIPLKYDKQNFSPAVEGGCWVNFKRRENLM